MEGSKNGYLSSLDQLFLPEHGGIAKGVTQCGRAVLIPSKVCFDRANATHLALSFPNTAAIHLGSSFAQQGLKKIHAEITPAAHHHPCCLPCAFCHSLSGGVTALLLAPLYLSPGRDRLLLSSVPVKNKNVSLLHWEICLLPAGEPCLVQTKETTQL